MPILPAMTDVYPDDLLENPLGTTIKSHLLENPPGTVIESHLLENPPGTVIESHLLENPPGTAIESPLEEVATRRWWVAYNKPRQEKLLARHLLDFGVPFYLPLIPKDNLIRGRRVRSYVPVFSSYVFMFCCGNERVLALKTNRIIHVLPVDDQAELQHDLMQLKRLIESNAPLTAEKRLAPGKRVRVRRGPFEGMEGTVIIRRGSCRLLIALNFLQQGASMEIDDFLLEPLD
jgi:transcription antitermination factor NusG